MKIKTLLLLFLIFSSSLFAQNSIAKRWTEHLIFAVRNDFARPTVHSRNLFHASIVMYDAWAAYENDADFYLLGKTFGNFQVLYEGVPSVADKQAAQEEAISFAMYRLLMHRFQNSPGLGVTFANVNAFMDSLGYDKSNISKDYIHGGPAELGNYIADRMIAYGYLDGSNEIGGYSNLYYQPIQDRIQVEQPGNPNMIDPNHWQAISLSYAVDQAGNVLSSDPPFLSPEWGNVVPFALQDSVKSTYSRAGHNYNVYHDPGAPASLDTNVVSQLDSYYKWNFSLVSVWQSHLDPADTTIWDISPASLGNISTYPTQFSDYPNFYNYFEGGDIGQGYALNPVTGAPYTPQLVKRADYARVIAEFWADGLSSETPPGHWFVIYNQVSNHPLYEKKWKGQGAILNDLEYDVKAYLTLGGALYDAGICAWGIKGWYDYVRPVSALRYMAEKGQSSIDTLANYHPAGLPLVPGYIEIVELGDPLAGASNQHVGKIKLYTWKGPTYITNPATTYAGVDWILAENWWPYQRPSFVTPPFAGYVSGHSTFSRAAAEVMTFITGNPFFPGGMSNFVALQNDFLEFEDGPSADVILQWASYRDASDQCSLSRIWGGIHPPIDDINGRLIGEKVGISASALADDLFDNQKPIIDSLVTNMAVVDLSDVGQILELKIYFSEVMDMNTSPEIFFYNTLHPLINSLSFVSSSWLSAQEYQLNYLVLPFEETVSDVRFKISKAKNLSSEEQNPVIFSDVFYIDKEKPLLTNIIPSTFLINDDVVAGGSFCLDLFFNETCDTTLIPVISFTPNPSLVSMVLEPGSWLTTNQYRAYYSLMDNSDVLDSIDVQVSNVADLAANAMNSQSMSNVFSIRTKNPIMLSFTVNDTILTRSDIAANALILDLSFNQTMNTNSLPILVFDLDPTISNSLVLNQANSYWLSNTQLKLSYNLLNQSQEFLNIDLHLDNVLDFYGNGLQNSVLVDILDLDTKKPELLSATPNASIISDNELGASNFYIDLLYDEAMNTTQKPIVELFSNGAASIDASFNVFASQWQSSNLYRAMFNVSDNQLELEDFALHVNFGIDAFGNAQNLVQMNAWIDLDTRNPKVLSVSANTYDVVSLNDVFEIICIFDERMHPDFDLEAAFAQDLSNVLQKNSAHSTWLNDFTFLLSYDVLPGLFNAEDIDLTLNAAKDLALNEIEYEVLNSFFSIHLEAVGIREISSKLKIYPNPSTSGENLNILCKDCSQEMKITFIDVLGQVIASEEASQNSNGQWTFLIPSLEEGTIIVLLENGDDLYHYKLVLVN